ncbi:MAG TPA: hypothetical protein ENH02_08700 [Bacteroidetes bacterium]|nr:hypothetical protein [Bacteroidota bacterium]
MIKLEIIVQPKHEKYLEFSQSLESIKDDIQQLCCTLSITEGNKVFYFIAEMNSTEQLTKILYSKELSIISGAIAMLAEKSEVIIHGVSHIRKGSNLQEIRLNYLNRKKKPSINEN